MSSAVWKGGSGSKGVAPKTLGEETYFALRRDIVSGRLPPGTRLPFRQLGVQYECGIAPLREALSRLASERLVLFEGQRGFTVAPVSLEELQDLCALRVEMSVAALRLAIEQGDDDWEAEILAALHRLLRAPLPASPSDEVAIEDWERRHARFHESLIAACGSPWRLRFCSMLSDQFERYRRVNLRRMAESDHLSQQIDDQHREIAEATIGRDADRAARLLTDHFREGFLRVAAHYRLLAGEAVDLETGR